MMRTRMMQMVLGLGVALCSVRCGPEDVASSDSLATSADVAWWRGLSQIDRDRSIINAAYRDYQVDTGVNCKVWVQTRVVPYASHGVAYVPITYPDGDGWAWQYGSFAHQLSLNVRQVFPGKIIQMNLWDRDHSRMGPHTMIVVGRTNTGIHVIDSNWYSRYSNVVFNHFIAFSDFDQMTWDGRQNRYTVYEITGGE